MSVKLDIKVLVRVFIEHPFMIHFSVLQKVVKLGFE